MPTHEELKEIFEDTRKFCAENELLKKSVENSIAATKIYLEDDYPGTERKIFSDTAVSVSRFRTFEAAGIYREKFPECKIAVLNFASATNPGGGVKRGSRAQEESLCRCSTLYPTLNTDELWKKYYDFHRARKDSLYTGACIYTPEIFVVKTDADFPQRLPPEKFFKVDVLTCAAPNLRRHKDRPKFDLRLTDEELFKVHVERGRHILTIAAHHEVDVLILGAFGCGAFKNNPAVVAKAYAEILPSFKGYFKEISFAVYCPPGKDINFETFKKFIAPQAAR